MPSWLMIPCPTPTASLRSGTCARPSAAARSRSSCCPTMTTTPVLARLWRLAPPITARSPSSGPSWPSACCMVSILPRPRRQVPTVRLQKARGAHAIRSPNRSTPSAFSANRPIATRSPACSAVSPSCRRARCCCAAGVLPAMSPPSCCLTSTGFAASTRPSASVRATACCSTWPTACAMPFATSPRLTLPRQATTWTCPIC